MQAQPIQAEPTQTPQPAAEPPRPHANALEDLIAMGLGIARILHQQVEAAHAAAATNPEAAARIPTLAIAFERVSRSVRRTVLLARHIEQAGTATQNPADRRTDARRRIIRTIENLIHARAPREAAAFLEAELRERLDAPECADAMDRDIATRPVADIIEDLARDLGLRDNPPIVTHKRRTPADIARLEARAAGRPIPPRAAAQPAPAPPAGAPRRTEPIPLRPVAPPRQATPPPPSRRALYDRLPLIQAQP